AVDHAGLKSELPLAFHTVDGRAEYLLPPGASEISVPMEWADAATGVSVRRTLTLHRASYVLDVADIVANRGTESRQLFPFERLARVAPPAPAKHSFMTNPDSFSFVGSAWFSPEGKFKKAPFSKYTSEA